MTGAPGTFETDTRRARLRSDLEAARGEFHALVASISEQAWTEPSQNPGWTNGQLLFHVLLGFILVPPLAGILVFFGHLPTLCSKIFAGSSTSRLRLQSNQCGRPSRWSSPPRQGGGDQ